MKNPPFPPHDPHQKLGLHKGSIRLYRPDASEIYIELEGKIVSVPKGKQEGLFELKVGKEISRFDYKVYHHSGLLTYDPYVFLPSLGDLDLHLFSNGVHYEIYNHLGAHKTIHEGKDGVKFAVWAPSAKNVYLVGDFNHWDPKVNPMRSLGSSGIFELFVPGLNFSEKYKFMIETQKGEILTKSDPYAYQMEQRPKTASIVSDVDSFAWSDQEWMKKREEGFLKPHPINIYELHLGSWRTPYGKTLNYKEVALELSKYIKEMGYTHVEFMPLQEHPLDESWGYQVTGFYSVTSRFGNPSDFQWLVNHLHEEGIGVILDWVPGHFPIDDFALSRFDGTPLYEHADPKEGFHPHWNTYIFNFGRKEVSNFLIANALFWFEKMHIDGLRVDAVASMLYRDYGRDAGLWIPNVFGGKENLEAIEFLKHLNSAVHQRTKGVLMIAEESTSFKGVTKPVFEGGLGFDMKWNMGWMNDSLRFFQIDPLYRSYHTNDLTFGLLYVFSENFILALSHDETVHGKKSLLQKMPGDPWQKFANLRLLLSYQMCQPGKKLLFMGGEFGQWIEWNCKGELDWALIDIEPHKGLLKMVKELNHFYLANKALWENDFNPVGFSWLDFSDQKNMVFSYFRKSSKQNLLCIHHFTPNYEERYFLRLPFVKKVKEVFNSDALIYGGSGKVNSTVDIVPDGLIFKLPPLATMIYEVDF